MLHQRVLLIVFGAIILLAAACDAINPPPASNQPRSAGTLHPVTARDLQIVAGQTIYIPAYSEIFDGSINETVKLMVTLAIHNTDPTHDIIIESVSYFDTDGNLVRDYVSESVAVRPMATTGFIVEERDVSGGWGSNFLVDWVAEEAVYEPIIEAVMISTTGSQGISLISPGRVLTQIFPEDITTETSAGD